MTQIGWKYQDLTLKYNIDLKLQIYIYILTKVYVKILKKLSCKNKNIPYILLKQYYAM